MAYKQQRQGNWWSARSRRGKLLLLALAVLLIVLALGLGFGLGIGLRNRNNDSDDIDDEPTDAQTLAPTPSNLGIWQPAVNSTWQIILLNRIVVTPGTKSVMPNVDNWDIDLFLTSKETIDSLHALGKKVVCYFSAGSYEPDRPDSKDFLASDQGKGVDGWPGEKWLNLRSQNVRTIVGKRLELAAQKGCDGVDPDNLDAYDNNNGLGMTKVDTINFVKFLTQKAQSLKLAVGLKNAAAVIDNVLPAVQFSVNEQCVQYSECENYAPFIEDQKPVLHIEYPSEVKKGDVASFCEHTGAGKGSDGFSTVIKNFNLDNWVKYCDGKEATTPNQS